MNKPEFSQRDYIALKAMQSLVQRGWGTEYVAKEAYTLADSMLAQRDRTPDPEDTE